MKHDLKSRRLLCDVLNKLFWKCPIPQWMQEPRDGPDAWAEYWLAELRDAPEGQEITGIKWSAKDSLFVPCRERK